MLESPDMADCSGGGVDGGGKDFVAYIFNENSQFLKYYFNLLIKCHNSKSTFHNTDKMASRIQTSRWRMEKNREIEMETPESGGCEGERHLYLFTLTPPAQSGQKK